MLYLYTNRFRYYQTSLAGRNCLSHVSADESSFVISSSFCRSKRMTIHNSYVFTSKIRIGGSMLPGDCSFIGSWGSVCGSHVSYREE